MSSDFIHSRKDITILLNCKSQTRNFADKYFCFLSTKLILCLCTYNCWLPLFRFILNLHLSTLLRNSPRLAK